jgi:hypothetical protein
MEIKQDRQWTYKRIIEPPLFNHCCCVKARNSTYSECVSVAVVIERTRRMCRFVLLPVAYLTVQYFSTLSHNGTIFGNKFLNVKRLFWYSLELISKIFLIIRRIQRDIINVH